MLHAHFFPQAYLLKNDENKAMSPAKLQDELNNILKFNPDFAEAVSSFFLFNNWKTELTLKGQITQE